MTSRPFTTLFAILLAAALLSPAGASAQQPPPPGAPPAPDAAAPIVRSPPRPSRDPGRPQPPMMSRGFRSGDDMSSGSRIAPPGLWWKNPDTIQKLSITDDQQKKMDGIFQQSRLQLIDLKANLEKQDVILQPMLDANPPDTNKVLAQIDHVAQARADLEKANARMLLGIRSVLTADQWTKLQADRGSRHSMYKGSGGPSGGPGASGGMPGGGGRQFHSAYSGPPPQQN